MSAVQNHILECLAPEERRLLLACCETVQLQMAQVLCEPGGAPSHIHLPVEGFVSQLAITPGLPPLEVGMIGREGVLGIHRILGVAASPWRSLVQGAGSSWRITAVDFDLAVARSPPLKALLLRYVLVCMTQLSQSALCLRYHQLGPRLARWLLMSQDRAHRPEFHVTQDFLSTMLGVRRVGVTAAAGQLQRLGLIAYRRGDMRVLDRAGLEAAACSCYARDLTAYAALMA